jgi:iron-sulfur cluster repair protein YtfE (RIC family)
VERYTAATLVGDAACDAASRAILEAFGLNHCCGAHLTLREGAAAAGVAVDDVLAALNAPAAVTT